MQAIRILRGLPDAEQQHCVVEVQEQRELVVGETCFCVSSGVIDILKGSWSCSLCMFGRFESHTELYVDDSWCKLVCLHKLDTGKKHGQ